MDMMAFVPETIVKDSKSNDSFGPKDVTTANATEADPATRIQMRAQRGGLFRIANVRS
jgi:hypothetical protein